MKITGTPLSRWAAGATLGMLLAAAVGATARRGSDPSQSPVDEVTHRESCYIQGLSRPAECVSLQVPLDWSTPGGPEIEVTAVLITSAGRRHAHPLFVLPGGPGQGASRYGSLVNTAFGEVRKDRDIVLIDPRGTGLSTPFDCDLAPDPTAPPTPAERARLGRACAAGAPADAAFFTAREVVEDIDRIRAALGYETIDVWGGSFGTRLAQYYVMQHGDRVGAAIFDGPVPTASLVIETAPHDSERAVSALYSRCASDPTCNARFPSGQGALDAVLAGFDAPRALRYPDPLTDTLVEIVVDRDGLAETIRGALYAPATATMVPLAVEAVASGDPAPLAALAAETAGWSTSTQQMGALLAIMCSEEAAPLVARARPVLPNALFRDGYSRFFLDFCSGWPTRSFDEAFRFPGGRSPIPALVLSGAMDPVAPPHRGEELARLFTTHVTLVVRNGGHINSARGCAPRLLAAFLDAPRAPLDGSCLDAVAWPPFALSALGPVALR